VTLKALIKFLYIILIRLNKLRFENFPTSLYMAKKLLNIIQPKMQLAVCTSCHKLYDAKKIIAYKEKGKVATMNCLHNEYPNNSVLSRSHQCNNLLSILKKNKATTITVPYILYPRLSIYQQLSMLY
jgi:hypothetical protein